ncbi:vacuolar protein sorting 33A-like protein [Xylariaceae sp. FL1272]|nr:vacuolar protein sorting 33A-like protein [Xylariaceae sp. FL1272]
MAPYVGFDTEHIRDKARKDLLDLLEGVRGKKNLVIERSLAGPIGVIVKVSTLHDYGIDKFFFLETNNVDTSQRNVVFMARGECARHAQAIADQIKRLQRESQSGHEFHIFWIPRRTLVSDKILEEAGVLGDVNIAELPIYFFPLERDVLSLELDDSFRDLYLFKDATPAFLMAKALMGLQSKLGLVPRIIGKGDNAKKEFLAGNTGSETNKAGLTPSSSIESVIIIDREVDFVTPLLTQLTYEGLIDEVWGIQNNQTDIDSTIVGAPAQASSQSASGTPAPTPSRKRKVQLDSSDKLYDGLRDTNFAIVGTLLNKVARRLQNDYESRHGTKTTAELKDFVKKLPGYQAEHQSLKIHTGLAEEIMKHTRTDQFSRLLEAQQNLAAGADPSSQHDAIEELIARNTTLPEVLRLLCIYSCISGGVKSKDFDQFRRLVLEGYGHQHLLTLHNLEKLQLFLSRSSPMASMIPMPGTGNATGTKTNYTYLRKQLRLIVDEVNEHDPDDIAYVYSGYAPLSIRLVQCILEKPYLLSITRNSAVGGGVTMSGGGAQGWRGFDEVVKHARGPAFDEVQKGEDKAVKARALLSGGGDKKTVFVVFVGGVTFTEISALRFIAKKKETRRNIVICTTSIISGNRMMEAAIEKKSFARDENAKPPHSAEHITTEPSLLLDKNLSLQHTPVVPPADTSMAEAEIVVKTEATDMEPSYSTPISTLIGGHIPLRNEPRSESTPLLSGQENMKTPPETSTSIMWDQSEQTSTATPSSIPPSSKATTPVDFELSHESKILPSVPSTSPIKRKAFDVRPRVSIPTDIAQQDYAHQCIAAAEASRLNPYALHKEEYAILREHISHAQVTTYLNIRNGILRLWINNPRIGVAREEAIGCAKDPRWYDVASVCYDFLVRSGHINFGSAEVPLSKKRHKKAKQLKKGKTVVVVGAGMSGLGCARQLDSLFKQYAGQFHDLDQEAPRVVVLEGRSRLGGRVYSRALDSSKSPRLIGFKGKRHSVECGGMIITGFERGNPMNVLVRGQLALPYHTLRPDAVLYDTNVEKLYNDCLERVSDYKFKGLPSKLIEGNKDLIDEGRDGSAEGPRISLVPVSTDRATGRTHAAYKARMMGWALREGITNAPNSTLDIVDLTAQDFRLMNWHVANLEYSNATNYHQLSIRGWDIDAGNEWEGKHTMVVGGYQNVPLGLAISPSRLDIRKNMAATKIRYDPNGVGGACVECEDGSKIDADYVVSTIPLGVLKHGSVEFDPPLPEKKTGAIGRLGFGILNKIILVYDHVFWDASTDIFGCLRLPPSRHSLKQNEYASQRGRCFQWFNVSNTSGIPVLLALMAGDAGFDTEYSKNDELVAEATQVLRSVFGAKVPRPVQSIVTRWGSDRFARGSYSSAGPEMGIDDYQTMAQSTGNLFFAGEHTTETHPATVHGAYLSGLRAASQVLDTMLGPIYVPTPLVRPRESALTLSQALKRKGPNDMSSPKASKQARIDAYEQALWQHAIAQIGEPPWRPPKVAGNAYILYNKANYYTARQRCEEGRRAGKGKPNANEVRVMTSKMWKEATAEDRKPFEDLAAEQKTTYNAAIKKWEEQAKEWNGRFLDVRAEYQQQHKLDLEDDEETGEAGRERRRANVASYAESEDSDMEMGG